jgi:hypothetical protein
LTPPDARAPSSRSLAQPNAPTPPTPHNKQQQIGVAVGCLAILDQRLRTIPVVYSGPDPRFKGQTARVEYCLLSSSSSSLATAQPSRCQLATAAPSASLGLSVLWVLIRGLARERAPGANPVPSIVGARVAESAVAALGAGWWLAMGVVISLWTSQANAVKDPPLPNADWRNTMSFLYWLNFLLFIALMGTSVILAYLTKMRASGRVPPGGGWRAKPAAAATGAAPSAAVAAPAVAHVPSAGGAAAVPGAAVAAPAHTAVNVAPVPAH